MSDKLQELLDAKAKKDARELVEKFIKILINNSTEYINYTSCAKACAIESINETIIELQDLIPTSSHSDIMQFKNVTIAHIEHFNKVINEINKL